MARCSHQSLAGCGGCADVVCADSYLARPDWRRPHGRASCIAFVYLLLHHAGFCFDSGTHRGLGLDDAGQGLG